MASRLWPVAWLAAAGAAAVAAGALLTRFAVAGDSMAPALRDGDWVVARRVRRVPGRGVVVVFTHPNRDGFSLVKRIIGLPGEEIVLAGGTVAADGAPLDEPWATGRTEPDGAWRLGPSEVFVLGDNRLVSADDSRMLGPVPGSAVQWRVFGRYWPPRRR